ncbi:MAG: hypothetical protein ACLTA0_02770 [Streptococcus agalactiae]
MFEIFINKGEKYLRDESFQMQNNQEFN